MSSASPAAAVQLCYEHLNGSCMKTPYSPAPRLILYTVFTFGAVLTIWKSPGDDFHSPLQAAAFSNQFFDRFPGLCGLHGGSDCDALQHSEVRGELLVLWGELLSTPLLF